MKFTSIVVTLPLLLIGQDTIPNLDVIPLNGKDCGLTGDARSDASKDLDRHKNRYRPPADDQVDTGVSLTALLSPGDDEGRFDDDKGATVVGFVVNVKVGGKETCNCHAASPAERDTHIELALDPGAPEVQRVIVEVTPRTRLVRKALTGQNDWTTPALQNARTGIKGKWVKVTGWLTFDTAHIGEAENTNPGNPKNWRATCWEVHPVTSIEILEGPPASALRMAPALLGELQKAHVQHLKNDPKRRQAIEERNKKVLAGFDKDELEDELD